MLELVQAGGWLMYPILLCSIIAAGIVAERLWTLQTKKVIPEKLMTGIWNLLDKGQMTEKHVIEIERGSPLGRVLAAGLINRHLSRDLVRESIEETGRFVTHELEKFLNTLGTISTITPLLGLLGTVIGMIKVFTAITTVGVGDPAVLAGGISEALITTATGLSVAIPSLIFYRFLKRKIDELVVGMEQEAMKLVEVLHGERHLSKSNISKSNISKSNVTKSNIAESNVAKKSVTKRNVTKRNVAKSNATTKSNVNKSNKAS